MSRTSILAGESKSRGLLSGRKKRSTLVAWIITAIAAGVLILLLQMIGLVISLVGALVLFLATLDSDGGTTPLRRWQDRRRMKWRHRTGFVDFIPVDWRPIDLGPDLGTSGKERRESRRDWNSYRDWPDGAEHLYWLESRPGRPAVAYHTPAGERTPFLTVAFSVDGPIRGLHGDAFVAAAQESFGQLLAGWGASQKLVSAVQIVTRVIPSDSAFHEVWLEDQLDSEAPAKLQTEYGRLLDDLSLASFIQRHYVVIRWDVDSRFNMMAARRGPGLDGYLDLINEQTAVAERRLVDAKYGRVRPASGPRLAAVLRHMQHPDWPIDQAGDVTPDTCWLPSHDEDGWTEVVSESPDPLRPELMLPPTSWLHRTAEVPVAAMEVRELDGLWEAPLLTGMEEQIVRTFSTQIAMVPARDAKMAARRDATSDNAEILSQQRKGRMVDDEAELAMSSAVRRFSDLRDGGGHHGAVWAQWITISARSVDELNAATAHIEEAADGAGIGRLDWMDTRHSAACAATWPLGRGLEQPRRSRASRAAERLTTGRDRKRRQPATESGPNSAQTAAAESTTAQTATQVSN